MKKVLFILIGIILFISLTSCADSQNVTECLVDHTYGFWGGLWHGMIALFSFIGSLFSDDISIYAVNNNGGWYNFGFIIGIGALAGSSKIK